MPKLVNKRFTLDVDRCEIFKYNTDDEVIDGYECFESFGECQKHLISLLEGKLEHAYKLTSKDAH